MNSGNTKYFYLIIDTTDSTNFYTTLSERDIFQILYLYTCNNDHDRVKFTEKVWILFCDIFVEDVACR